MKLKTIVATLGVVSLATAGTAFGADSSVNSQVAQLQAQLNKLQAQVQTMNQGGQASAKSGSGLVHTNAVFSKSMLENQSGVGREMKILMARKDGQLMNGGVYFGGQGKLNVVYQRANNKIKDISVLTKFSKNGAQSATGIGFADTSISMLATINPWVTAYFKLGVNQDLLIGQKPDQGNAIPLQDGYFVLGDLSKTPVYAFAGLKDVDFGSFQSVNFFTQPLNRLAFEAHGTTMGVGYAQNGFNGTISVMNGGISGQNNFKVINLYTRTGNQLNNFAANVGYGMSQNGIDWHVGAGYLNGSLSAADNQSTVDAKRNGAWDLNAEVHVMGLKLIGEYTQTTGDLENTNYNVKAWNIGGEYGFPVMGYNSAVNLSYSAVKFDKSFSQIVAGYRMEAIKNLWVGLEYAYNNGTFSVNQLGGTGSIQHPGISSNAVTMDVTAFF